MKNKRIISLLVVFVAVFVALLFLSQRSAPINKVLEKPEVELPAPSFVYDSDVSEVNQVGETATVEAPAIIVEDTNVANPAPAPAPADNRPFSEKVISLDTSNKLIAYLNKYYSGRDSREMSVFGARVLAHHKYETAIIKYETATGLTNAVVVFRDGDTPRYITATNDGIKMFAYGWSFGELLQMEEQRLNTKIVRFAILSHNADLSRTPQWTAR